MKVWLLRAMGLVFIVIWGPFALLLYATGILMRLIHGSISKGYEDMDDFLLEISRSFRVERKD